MFGWLRKNRERRLHERRRDEFERAAAESDPSGVPDDRRARDLPDELGDFNETARMGPSIGGTGTTGGP